MQVLTFRLRIMVPVEKDIKNNAGKWADNGKNTVETKTTEDKKAKETMERREEPWVKLLGFEDGRANHGHISPSS